MGLKMSNMNICGLAGDVSNMWFHHGCPIEAWRQKAKMGSRFYSAAQRISFSWQYFLQIQNKTKMFINWLDWTDIDWRGDILWETMFTSLWRRALLKILFLKVDQNNCKCCLPPSEEGLFRLRPEQSLLLHSSSLSTQWAPAQNRDTYNRYTYIDILITDILICPE